MWVRTISGIIWVEVTQTKQGFWVVRHYEEI